LIKSISGFIGTKDAIQQVNPWRVNILIENNL